MEDQFYIHGVGAFTTTEAIALLQEIVPIACQYRDLHGMSQDLYSRFILSKHPNAPKESLEIMECLKDHMDAQYGYCEDTVMRKILSFAKIDISGLP